ncbi:peptide deformylase [Pararhizobium antarcticum]|uniref:Peptide deformylase-like n=1 Tax=Pararhizobium antarcticum TaxID=1798805 RepID=A0A657LTG3_9HYPH|nr:peptide deformylase [Pararhizobium antarcticum]OJF95451.1 peptide deformylase [Rhizobium sp. 58]OJF97929.1 peptide deformylase [Pararhizobium antarcticum]
MTIRPILRFPHPLLRAPAAAVTEFDAALAALAQDLLETMRTAPGIGITAPHIGVMLRLAVIELDAGSGVRTYVNPVVISSASEILRHAEGSVSMPGVTEEVERPRSVRIRYQTLSGEPREDEADGLLGICLQHEIDQLDGLFWTQRLSRLKRDRVNKRFDKLRNQPD